MILGVTVDGWSGDFDDAPVNQTVFVVGTSLSNAPITGVIRGYLTTLSKSGYPEQVYIECNQIGYVDARFSRVYKSGAWTSWQRIDNYGTTSLEGLASALGGLPDYSNPPLTNINDIEDSPSGIYSFTGSAQNRPSFLTVWGWMIHIKAKIEIIFAHDGSAIGFKATNGTWKQFAVS